MADNKIFDNLHFPVPSFFTYMHIDVTLAIMCTKKLPYICFYRDVTDRVFMETKSIFLFDKMNSHFMLNTIASCQQPT